MIIGRIGLLPRRSFFEGSSSSRTLSMALSMGVGPIELNAFGSSKNDLLKRTLSIQSRRRIQFLVSEASLLTIIHEDS